MNKLLLLSILLFFIASSCEDEIIINTEFEEEYVLTCVMDADSQEHMAVLTRSYAIEGFNPEQNTDEKYIEGAEITLRVGSNEYTFKDTLTERTEKDRYVNPVKFYHVKNVRRLIESNVEINAKLPDGTILNSNISVPQRIQLERDKSDDLIPPSEKAKTFSFTWRLDTFDRLFFDPRLKLIYYIEEDGIDTRYEKEIPIRYNEVGNKLVPEYRSPSYRKTIDYSVEILNSMLEEISIGDDNKSKYKIGNLLLEILTYDEFLTSYYVGTHFLDRFSIRIDEVDYSNINGGLGIFGAYIRTEYDIALDTKYIRSFGYERKILK